MKKFVFLFLFIFSFFLNSYIQAGHVPAGAQMSYRYIGDSTGVTNEYLIELIIFGGDGYGTGPQPICISSSCGTSTTVNFPKVMYTGTNNGPTGGGGSGGWPITSPNCANSDTSIIAFNISKHIYRDTIVLNCLGDFTFSWTDCCRDGAIMNLAAVPGRYLYVEATLNNRFGPNTSPQFQTDIPNSFCVGRNTVWSQSATEPDGDSLYYDFGTLQEAAFGCPAAGTDIPFNTSYSKSNPFRTINGIRINHSNGTFRFTPSDPEVVALKVIVTDYRFDTASLSIKKIGSSMRDMMVQITANCSSGLYDVPQITTDSNTINSLELIQEAQLVATYGVSQFSNERLAAGSDVLKVPVVPYNCHDPQITLDFDSEILCETAVPSDFRLIGPDGLPRPITSVNTQCNPSLGSKQLKIALHKVLDVNGDYLLYIKDGNDGNTLINRCGLSILDHYALIVRVNNCPVLDYTLENVTVNFDESIEIFWSANDTSYNSSLFDSWRILRSNNSQAFYQIAEVPDINIRSFLDSALTANDVDNQIYKYQVQAKFNGNNRAATNSVSSMLLSSQNPLKAGSTASLSWNNFDGWNNPQYDLFLGTFNSSTNSISWSLVKNVGAAQSTTFNVPNLSPNNIGDFFLKIVASNPSNPNESSESNWMDYKIDFIAVPNLITPNNDGANDNFSIDLSPTPYTNVALKVFSRNGFLLVDYPNFHQINNPYQGWNGNDRNGQPLADGVYFYTIEFSNPASGQAETKNGQVTIYR